MSDQNTKEAEPIASKEEVRESILDKISKEKGLGKLSSCYYAQKYASGWAILLDLLGLLTGGSGSTEDSALYSIGLTDSHFIMQLMESNFLPHPSAKPVIAEIDQVRCVNQQKSDEKIQYVIKVSGVKYKFFLSKKIRDWKGSEKDFNHLVTFFNDRS